MLNVVQDFWLFLRERKKLWLLPIVLVVLLMLGSLLLLARASAAAPFMYKLF